MIQGPFLDGSFSRNNQFNVSVSPGAATPAGALLWIVAGTAVADTANVSVTDTKGNVWEIQAFNQLPGTGATILVAIARNAAALGTGDFVTITSDIRGNWDGILFHHTGAVGAIFSRDLEYFDANTTAPSATCQAQENQTLVAIAAVAGPRSDAYTQDGNWSADQKTSLTGNVTAHCSGRVPSIAGAYSYAPVLGVARKTFLMIAAFN